MILMYNVLHSYVAVGIKSNISRSKKNETFTTDCEQIFAVQINRTFAISRLTKAGADEFLHDITEVCPSTPDDVRIFAISREEYIRIYTYLFTVLYTEHYVAIYHKSNHDSRERQSDKYPRLHNIGNVTREST